MSVWFGDTAEDLAALDESMERLEEDRWRLFLAGKPAWRFFYGLTGEWTHQEANGLTWEQARERVAKVLAGFADEHRRRRDAVTRSLGGDDGYGRGGGRGTVRAARCAAALFEVIV